MNTRYWQHEETGRTAIANEKPGRRWFEIGRDQYERAQFGHLLVEVCTGVDPVRCDNPKCPVHGEKAQA